jgi:F0F1-type ATP synthase epsilon subunit
MAKAKSQTAKPAVDHLGVKVFSPYQVYYEGPAQSVSGVNDTGPFDILLNHANFFSLLVPCRVIVNTGFERFAFPINRGILKVRANQVRLFVDV